MNDPGARRYACEDPVIHARNVQALRAALRRRARRLATESADAPDASPSTSTTEGAAAS